MVRVLTINKYNPITEMVKGAGVADSQMNVSLSQVVTLISGQTILRRRQSSSNREDPQSRTLQNPCFRTRPSYRQVQVLVPHEASTQSP
jgi:hypothetical protein